MRLIEETLKCCKLEEWGLIDTLVSELLSIYALVTTRGQNLTEI